MARPLRLHLGCGNRHWPGFINHDSEISLLGLPYPNESAEMIYAIHLFEHLPRLEVDEYLEEWRRVLIPGGKLVLEMPCLDKIARHIVNEEKNLRLTVLGIFGDPYEPSPLMRHQWCYTEKEATKVLNGAGFAVTTAAPTFHFKERDMRIIGRKE